MIAALTQLAGYPLQSLPIDIANADQSVVPGSSLKKDSIFRRRGGNDVE
jgi:hypothetical protein